VLGQAGQIFVLVALAAAMAGAVTGFAAGSLRSHGLLRWTQTLSRWFAVSMTAAVAVMETALIRHDFSVKYVSEVGSLQTPLYITIVSLWSSLSGSILLWGLILAIFVGAFTEWSRDRHPENTPWSLATMLVICAFFSFLIAGPANPFTPAPSPVPTDGPGPNPLLQNHVLMIVHPPMLYLGYVGMTVPFGMAVGALISGQLGPAWTQALRRALLIPWGFLSVGIVLGGWWAYAVLGWGGYWSWDPVENASFLPWLTATAALHSAMLPSRRDALKGWTVTLVLVTFVLTLLGTFMTRSGVFNSVHSFTQSDIGPIFLAFLGAVLIACVLLLASRIDKLAGEGANPTLISRESSFLVNNLLLVGLCFTVLLGTTFPLIMEAVKGVRLSVGEPYFNQVAMPTGVALLFLMGVGPALPWGEPSLQKVAQALGPPVVASLVALGLGAAILGTSSPWTLATVWAAGFATYVSVAAMVSPVLTRMREKKESVGGAFTQAFLRNQRRYGGYVVHLGIVIIVVAVAISHAWRQDTEVTIPKGETVSFAGYDFRFDMVEKVREPHRTRQQVVVTVKGEGEEFVLRPALNQYEMSMNPIGSPDVHSTAKRDVYLSLLKIGDTNESISLHIYLNPVIAWLWWGMFVVIFGTLLTLFTIRRAPESAAAPVPAPQAAK